MARKPPPEVQAYLSKLPNDHRKTLMEMRTAILRAGSDLEETINPWGYITFSTSSARYAITLVPHGKHVNLQIFNGAKLTRVLPQLEGSGKGLRHIKFPYGMAVNKTLVSKAVRLSLAA